MKKILYVDMDNVLVDFPSAFPKIPPNTLVEYDGRLDEVPNIFSKMDPIHGAIDAYEKLSVIFDMYILSTSPWNNPSAWSDKLIWVKTHLGSHAYKRLILSHHKNLNCSDFLVDDRLKNGVDQFKGEHIHFGTSKFPDWETAMDYLMTKWRKVMTDKFIKVSVEEDAKILFQKEAKLGEFDVLYQKWFWDGITAESIIFANEDVAGVEEEDLKKEVKSSPLVNEDSTITFKRSDSGFTFINFNFRTE